MNGIPICNWYCEKCGRTIAAADMAVRGKHWCEDNHCGGKVSWIEQEIQPLGKVTLERSESDEPT